MTHRNPSAARAATTEDVAAIPQFSFPGGIPSYVAPETPGSMHECGELGHSMLHPYGAVFDHPDLLALCVASRPLRSLLEGYGYAPRIVEDPIPARCIS
jgi:phosphoketolase